MIPVQKTKNKTKQKNPPKLLLVSHRKSAKLLHLAFKVFFNLTQIYLFLLPYMDPISRKVISLISSSFTSAYIALPSSYAVFKSYSVSQGHNSSLTSGRIPPCPFLPILTGSFSELGGSGGCWNRQRPEQLLSPLVLSAGHVVHTLSPVSSARLGAISRFPISATVPGTQCWAQWWNEKKLRPRPSAAVPDQGFRRFPVYVVLSTALVYRTGWIFLLCGHLIMVKFNSSRILKIPLQGHFFSVLTLQG